MPISCRYGRGYLADRREASSEAPEPLLSLQQGFVGCVEIADGLVTSPLQLSIELADPREQSSRSAVAGAEVVHHQVEPAAISPSRPAPHRGPRETAAPRTSRWR